MSYKHSTEWLCEQHSIDKIKKWVNSLTSIYFFRAFGGHANDADYFGTALKFDDEINLQKIISTLDIEGFTEINSFGHRIINSYDWFISIDYKEKRIRFTRGTNYTVNDSDFEAAEDLDRLMEKFGLAEKVDRDLIFNSCCISKERYSELWD